MWVGFRQYIQLTQYSPVRPEKLSIGVGYKVNDAFNGFNKLLIKNVKIREKYRRLFTIRAQQEIACTHVDPTIKARVMNQAYPAKEEFIARVISVSYFL